MGESQKSKAPVLSDRAADHFNELERDIALTEPAWAKAALYFRTELLHHFGHKDFERRCQSMLDIQERIEVYRDRFERGDTLSLLQAVAMCAEENLPLPTWLALAFVKALDSFLSMGGPLSLDAVFRSSSLPTGTAKKTAEAKQFWVLGGAIFRATWDAAQADVSITSFDAALKMALSKTDFGVKKTTARRLYLMIEKNQLELLGRDKSKGLSSFLAKRRKL